MKSSRRRDRITLKNVVFSHWAHRAVYSIVYLQASSRTFLRKSNKPRGISKCLLYILTTVKDMSFYSSVFLWTL